MECIKGHEKKVSWQFIDPWKNPWVIVNGFLFKISEELIVNSTLGNIRVVTERVGVN